MAAEYKGIAYFPIQSNFYESPLQEMLEVRHGIKGPHLAMRLLCKIYKEGYYLPWDEDQCEILSYKLGREYTKEDVAAIVGILLEKEFFDKESFQKHGVLTSIEIQEVWMEATSRRKKIPERLPYLLVDLNQKQKGTPSKRNANTVYAEMHTNTENENTMQATMQANTENADSFRERKVNKITENESNKKMKKREETLLEPPAYALNKQTHNYEGLTMEMERIKVIDKAEVNAIMRLSNFGQKGGLVWKLLAHTNWNKISMPGKFIISALLKD